MKISLIIPVYNESKSIGDLIDTIREQAFQPAEIIIVDGGSTDNTVGIIKDLTGGDSRYRLVEAGRTMPGGGRNIGTRKATNTWIAYTDAGIKLDKYWLQNLVAGKEKNQQADIIYGNLDPQINSFFDKWSAITYVPGNRPGSIRAKSIASCLLKKLVWERVGGFPDWRAAEDLVFIEKVARAGFKIAFAPDAKIYWQLRSNVAATFRKFDLYSQYNVWAGRQAYWHYGVLRQYAIMLIMILAGIYQSSYWFWVIPAWIIARIARHIYGHRHDFGLKELFNPATYLGVMVITFAMDAGTFTGWIKAIFTKPPKG